jgi:hypothetical protein
MIRVICILFLCIAGISCSAQPVLKELKPNGGKQVVLLLDSTAAAQRIVLDKTDLYFNRVNPSEMSIQMKKSLGENPDRSAIVGDYVAFLKTDVASFTAEESKFLSGVMEKLYKTCAEVSNSILPDTLYLIKTKGRHYGDGVYYTREKCIVIPANELAARKTNPFTTTMYHELFHVYSRLNPEKRRQLYQLIGFEHIGLDQLIMPPALASRVLLNPDGVDFGQKITLKTAEGTEIHAIPVIYSKYVGHQEELNEFFAYLEFNLFQIEAAPGGKWQVITKEDGYSSVLSIDKLPDFFRQIKENTGYIIHPDEVLADNFSFIMVEKNGSKVSMRFSPEGKKLLTDIEAILKK